VALHNLGLALLTLSERLLASLLDGFALDWRARLPPAARCLLPDHAGRSLMVR
jgi:hypothetical protein